MRLAGVDVMFPLSWGGGGGGTYLFCLSSILFREVNNLIVISVAIFVHPKWHLKLERKDFEKNQKAALDGSYKLLIAF